MNLRVGQRLKSLFWDNEYDINVYEQVKFVEAYKDYTPPFPLIPELRSSLRVIPPKFLMGLNRIVLTNTGALPRRRRRAKTYSRKRTVRIPDAIGLYHPAWNGEAPYIEIFVNKAVIMGATRYYSQHLTILALSSVLFHEIGHHIHFTKYPEQGEWERIAEKHQKKYTKRLLWRQSFRHPVALASFLTDVDLFSRLWKRRNELAYSLVEFRKVLKKKRLSKRKRR
ncbi:MAG: hypothetical protein HUU46_21580 [Candidatus Hydrogenedentes bacterium]|nr:hypothetical protein [Candidatus Hydrogenedentota bacterium]